MNARTLIVNTAEKYLGVKKGSTVHKRIVDNYNSIKPLPNGYKLKYTDHWCAGFVGAIDHECGLDAYVVSSASCSDMIKRAKNKGMWIEADDYIPKPGDRVLYCWSDDKNNYSITDCTKAPDHVGIVANVGNKSMRIIEGNMTSKSVVGTRELAINGLYIRGFIVPKLDGVDIPDTPTVDYTAALEIIAKEVIDGKWGNGSERKRKLTQAGYDYKAVQSTVNKLLQH